MNGETGAMKLMGLASGMLLAAVALWWSVDSGNAANWYRVFAERFDSAKRVVEESTSPIRGPLDNPDAHLSVSGIVSETNRHRAEAGLAPLSRNSTLDASARAKLDDLFSRQYFEHVSPTGEGPSDLITEAGYKFIVVGENLALGNYENDTVLVQAWMDSPGHRANILKADFEEIGIAVGQGTFEGARVWLAVQHFGRPVSSCPSADAELQASIDVRQEQLDRMAASLSARKAQLDEMQEQGDPSYPAAAKKYNADVEAYNALLAAVRADIETYNRQVRLFNECAGATEAML